MAADADARSQGSMGSRGSRTYSAPPPTATAPNSARPIERTMTQPGSPARRPSRAARHAGGARPGGLFSRPGLLGGLAAGFLGAGLFGLLAGHGFMGGLGGIASFFGLLLQVGIVVAGRACCCGAGGRAAAQPATASGPSLRQALNGSVRASAASPVLGGGLGGGSSARAAPPTANRIEVASPRTSTRSSGCSARSRPPTARKTSARCARA